MTRIPTAPADSVTKAAAARKHAQPMDVSPGNATRTGTAPPTPTATTTATRAINATAKGSASQHQPKRPRQPPSAALPGTRDAGTATMVSARSTPAASTPARPTTRATRRAHVIRPSHSTKSSALQDILRTPGSPPTAPTATTISTMSAEPTASTATPGVHTTMTHTCKETGTAPAAAIATASA